MRPNPKRNVCFADVRSLMMMLCVVKAASGLLRIGDRLMSINGLDVSRAQRADCIAAVKAATQAGPVVQLKLERTTAPDDGSREVAIECGLCKFGGGFPVNGVSGMMQHDPLNHDGAKIFAAHRRFRG